MAIYSHLDTFAGKPIDEWPPEHSPFEPTQKGYAVRLRWEDQDMGWSDHFASLLEQDGIDKLDTLVVGAWHSWGSGHTLTAERVVEQLVAARDTLTGLRALFFGDIIMEESEISWIEQTDVGPLLAAYPDLRAFGVRGGQGLAFSTRKHPTLQTLIVQSGGLPRGIVQGLLMADLPQLRHLELWLGTDQYGGDTRVEDLAPLFSGEHFPKLTYLGLRDSDIVDDIAATIVNAPILERLEVLDLSLGTLTDAGARALVNSPRITSLKKLDLHHHYCSPQVIKALEGLDVEVDLDQPQDDSDGWRFVAVGE